MSDAAVQETPGAGLAPRAPVMELRGVSRRFSRGLDLAAKVAQRLGAPVKEEVVHAVDGVDDVLPHLHAQPQC